MTTCHIWHNENNKIKKLFWKTPHKDQYWVLVRVLP